MKNRRQLTQEEAEAEVSASAGCAAAAGSAHTPGPWDDPEMSPDGKRIIVTGGSDEWERLGCEVDSDDCCSETAMANARLIAAAPDLLAALIDCKAAGIMSAPAYAKTVAALAKALGPDWQNSQLSSPETQVSE